MNLNEVSLQGCTPSQIATISYPVNDMTNIGVLGQDGCEYDRDNLEYSYSLDCGTWSCFGSYEEIGVILADINSDYYLKIKVCGAVSDIIEVDNDSEQGYHSLEYTTQIAEGFTFDVSGAQSIAANAYNPYANMEGALQLQKQLTDVVANTFGVMCNYFKLAPNTGSKDITFKEYALMDVEAVKQIKIIINDNKMPSSKPEFADFGLEFQTDWEVEISKSSFATAFGNTAQPMEGDLIYIPMMKRMWMVSSAYEEKNGSLMWTANTFTLSLVKYQEKGSVDLGDTQEMVDSFVKNKYEDLFCDNENLDSGEEAVSTPLTSSESLYPIYESDATRKWITVGGIDIITHTLYYKGTLVCDNHYVFMNPSTNAKVIYQRKYCGDEGSVAFIIYPTNTISYNGYLLEVSDMKIKISQNGNLTTLSCINKPELTMTLTAGHYYMIWLRWSNKMNLVDFGAAKYTYPSNIPLYKVQNQHYYFDMDNLVSYQQLKFDEEFIIERKGDIILNQFYGTISNIKVFDSYNDKLNELLQQYPTNQHLLVNDTVRQLLDKRGPGLK